MFTEVREDLWISDIQDVREKTTGRFDVVVTVCQDSVEDNVGCGYVQFELSDGESAEIYGGECTFQKFRSATNVVVYHVRDGRTVLCHCHHGQSRSVTVSAAAMAVLDDITYREARSRIADKRTIHPDKKLEDFAKRYIEEWHEIHG